MPQCLITKTPRKEGKITVKEKKITLYLTKQPLKVAWVRLGDVRAFLSPERGRAKKYLSIKNRGKVISLFAKDLPF